VLHVFQDICFDIYWRSLNYVFVAQINGFYYMKTSRIQGFYKKTHSQRLEILREFCSISEKDFSLLRTFYSLDFDLANNMVENVVSSMPVPLGIATNFLINDRDYLVPMAIEEASVVAAASHSAKLARLAGGFFASASQPIMIGQVQIKQVKDVSRAVGAIEGHKKDLIEKANSVDPVLIAVDGGVRNIECRVIETRRGTMLIIHLLVDVRDAMGANIVNIMCEKLTPDLEKITGGKASLRIVSNLSLNRMVSASAVWKKEVVGASVIEEILDAYELACVDPFRCATHNKGIMNGIDAVAVATGNDFRAIEAGVHAYASFNSKYKPLSSYHKNSDGDLVGELEIPLAVGIVGGITQCHPIAKICLKILDVSSSCQLACVMCAVGLAQNFAALRALVSEGISKGHMRLHSKNIAIAAGVPKELVCTVARKMIQEDDISVGRARKLLQELGRLCV
jgi:hydroxymethylglutaryl-CoA reductase